MSEKIAILVALVLALAACGSGYTQEEVDGLVASAVSEAVAEQNDQISEAEAQKQVEAAVAQATLATAAESCAIADSPYEVADEGGLVMESSGNESRGVDYDEVLCALDELGIPDSVVQRILNTNSTMGLVEGSWGIYSASWSYHPDHGLFIHVVATPDEG